MGSAGAGFAGAGADIQRATGGFPLNDAVEALRAAKREGRKIVGVVAWDTPTARILDDAGVDIVSIGDSVAVNLWGRAEEGDVTLDELLLLCRAVRRGAARAAVSCDLPPQVASVEAALKLVDAGADLVKVEDRAAVAELSAAGIAVFAQLDGDDDGDLVARAHDLESAGAALLDFRHSGPELGPRVVEAVSIPVIGGLGGGPWLDGRMRMIHRLVGYGGSRDAYADVDQVTADAVAAYADDVRAGRQVKGG